MTTEPKFCGMRRKVDILAANACLPDYIGFTLTTDTRRAVDPETARELRGMSGSRIRAVGIFVDQSPEEIAETTAQALLDCIQLHGNKSEEGLERVRTLVGRPVWRASQTTRNEVLVRAEEGRADLLLFSSDKRSDKTFAREWLRDFSRFYMLAGGLDTESVGEVIRALLPRGVDVSSVLEVDGRKDSEEMRAFVEAVRRAGSEAER